MITNQNIKMLEEAEKSGKTLKQVIQTARDLNSLDESRDKLASSIFVMAEFASAWVKDGKYDKFLTDINGLIDQVQEDMKKDELWEQEDWSVIIETPEDGVEISTKTEEETPDAESLENEEKDV